MPQHSATNAANWARIFTAARAKAKRYALPFDFDSPAELAAAVGPRPTPHHRLSRKHSADGWTVSNLHWTASFVGPRRMNGFTWVLFGVPYPTLREAAKAAHRSEGWVYARLRDPTQPDCYRLPNKQPGAASPTTAKTPKDHGQ